MCSLKSSYSRVVDSTKRKNHFKNILVNVPGLKQYFNVCYIKLLMGCFTFVHYVQILWVAWRIPYFCLLMPCLVARVNQAGKGSLNVPFLGLTLHRLHGLSDSLLIPDFSVWYYCMSSWKEITVKTFVLWNDGMVIKHEIIFMETIDNQYLYFNYLYFNYILTYKWSRVSCIFHG